MKSFAKVEFGDFQTPEPLAASVCRVLKQQGISPACILEPTCGRGTTPWNRDHAATARAEGGVTRLGGRPRRFGATHAGNGTR